MAETETLTSTFGEQAMLSVLVAVAGESCFWVVSFWATALVDGTLSLVAVPAGAMVSVLVGGAFLNEVEFVVGGGGTFAKGFSSSFAEGGTALPFIVLGLTSMWSSWNGLSPYDGDVAVAGSMAKAWTSKSRNGLFRTTPSSTA